MYLWKHQQVKYPAVMHQLRFHPLIKVSDKYHLWHPDVHATSVYLEDVKLVLENFLQGLFLVQLLFHLSHLEETQDALHLHHKEYLLLLIITGA